LEREPITGEVELSYHYPAYMELLPRVVPGTNGEVSAPVGTEVRLRARSDRRVARAGLVVDQRPVPLQVSGGRELSGSFTVQSTGSYRFVFYTSGGRVVAEGPQLAIHAEEDAPPSVTLLTPPRELEVQPDERLTLKYQA